MIILALLITQPRTLILIILIRARHVYDMIYYSIVYHLYCIVLYYVVSDYVTLNPEGNLV